MSAASSRGVLVHEWIERHGGSENVLEAMGEAFPDTDVVCLWNNAPGRLVGHKVRETWLARTPARRSKALALPAMPLAWRHLPNAGYEWALVSSHAFAVQARFRRQADHMRKLVYAHTPARYIWAPDLDDRGRSLAARTLAPFLRSIDRRRAQEAHAVAANSSYVRSRIARSWGRDATVIHPPVDVARIIGCPSWPDLLEGNEAVTFEGMPEEFVFGMSRFIAYKKLDLVIRAGEVAGLPVVLAGAGPEEEHLRALARGARVPVHFVRFPSDALLYSLFAKASVFVFPAIEDFGIVPVEAMASGTPVVCGEIGGVTESIIDGVTGVHVHDWDDPQLGAHVRNAASMDPQACRRQAERFDRSRFVHEIQDWVTSALSA